MAAPTSSNVGMPVTYVPAAAAATAYRIYRALLAQSGSNAPVATVLENTFDEEIIWTRNNVGIYYTSNSITLFTVDKTFVIFTVGETADPSTGTPFSGVAYHDSGLGNQVGVQTFGFNEGTGLMQPADIQTTMPCSIEIRTYS